MNDNPVKLLIKFEDSDDDNENPHCPHGPTVLFYRGDQDPTDGVYACAAYRSRKLCNFRWPAKVRMDKHLRQDYTFPIKEFKNLRAKWMDENFEKGKHYCCTCNEPLKVGDLAPHYKHNVLTNLFDEHIDNPTDFLSPLDQNQGHAQFFFDEKSMEFFINCIRDLKFKKVICIGAPKLYAYLKIGYSEWVKSFLLDLDFRFFYFYDDTEFAWYNMCNNHFFDEKQKFEFYRFLRATNNADRCLFFVDPPFGCRTEVLAHTLQKLTKLYNKINKMPHQPLPIFWIYPYFGANYIKSQMPSMEMCDYKINYTNHTAYTDHGNKCRKLGSPVRLFTNVPLELISLPVKEGYKFCAVCQRYTALENRHCPVCKKCPSKNGSTYRHCQLCGNCVKPNYLHCRNCRRCVLPEGHNCEDYQAKQTCWICYVRGHIEYNCPLRPNRDIVSAVALANSNMPIIYCFLCDEMGHNEKNCKDRDKYFPLQSFMGEVKLKDVYAKNCMNED